MQNYFLPLSRQEKSDSRRWESNMIGTIQIILLCLLPFVVVFCSCGIAAFEQWDFRKRRQMIQEWADKQGFELISSRYRLNIGPLRLFHCRIRDRNGDEQGAWVRVPPPLLALLTKRQWDISVKMEGTSQQQPGHVR